MKLENGMFNAGMLAALLLASALASAADTQALRHAQAVSFHYGVVPAELVLSHPDRHPERAMHGGKPPRGSSHVVVALFDAASGERVSDAEITATVTPLGRSSVTKKLERMDIADQPSFGGFFSLAAPGVYRIRFEARLPGVAQPAVAQFEHRVPAEGSRR